MVILVHGCFWHGHKRCKRGKLPESNSLFWKSKIDKNIKRDTKNQKKIKKMGWDILVLWQCKLNDVDFLRKSILRFLEENK